jgi:hypothetical protein
MSSIRDLLAFEASLPAVTTASTSLNTVAALKVVVFI